jgi:hypothetical protein
VYQRILNDLWRTRGFLAVVWIGPLPHPPPSLSSQQVVSLSQYSCVSPIELIVVGGGGRGGRGWGRSQIILPQERAWSSINHSILSGVYSPVGIGEKTLARHQHFYIMETIHNECLLQLLRLHGPF